MRDSRLFGQRQSAHPADLIEKRRYIWDIRAWQLLREGVTSRYLRRTMPQRIREYAIRLPEIRTSVGTCIRSVSQPIAGQTLLAILHDQQAHESPLEFALVALEGLYSPQLSRDPFPLFGLAYRLVRIRKLMLQEIAGPPSLSRAQRAAIRRLAAYGAHFGKGHRRVLVHGDLHAANLIVSLEPRSIGFVDLEMVHAGSPGTDFAQLWTSFYLVDPALAGLLYHRHVALFGHLLDEYFDARVRGEVALRSYALIRYFGQRKELADRARGLLQDVLEHSLAELCPHA